MKIIFFQEKKNDVFITTQTINKNNNITIWCLFTKKVAKLHSFEALIYNNNLQIHILLEHMYI